MRSVNDVGNKKFLGKWIWFTEWGDYIKQSYLCVGYDRDNLYVYYHGNVYGYYVGKESLVRKFVPVIGIKGDWIPTSKYTSYEGDKIYGIDNHFSYHPQPNIKFLKG